MSAGLIFSVIAFAAAAGFFFGARSKQRKLHQLQDTRTVSVEHLRTLAGEMAADMGQGLLRFATEVRGRVRAAEPLRSELAGEPCVYYRMTVTREYEEQYSERDHRGRHRQGTRTGQETVASNRRAIAFELEDETGTIRIEPDGAEMVAEGVLSDFRSDGGRYARGIAAGSAQRTLGYRYDEQAIVVGREVYVLGEANDQHGTLRIAAPEEGRFLISTKSERELTRGLTSAVKWLRGFAIGFAVLGLVLLIL